MSEIGIEAIRTAWAQAQDVADRAVEKIRLETAARQADAWTALKSRQAAFPENRAPESPDDETGLREALRVSLQAHRLAVARLGEALEAGARAEAHCTGVRRRLGQLDEIERRHRGNLASIIRAGGSGDQLSPEVATARTQRPGIERDCAAADDACSVLAGDISRAQGEVDTAMAQVNAAAKCVMSSTARTIADRIAEHERAAAKLWHDLEPLAMLYFAGAKGTPGSPISLDEAVRKVFSARPRLAGTDDIPPQRKAAMAAAASDAWRQYFDALSTDPDAVFGPEISK